MTDQERIEDTRRELEAQIALQQLTARLRADRPVRLCYFCYADTTDQPLACPRCGWKVSA